MAGKQLCALASVAVLVALGLIAIVLGELPGDRMAEATPAAFPPDVSVDTASPVPAAVPDVRNQSLDLTGGERSTTPGELLVDDTDTIFAAPIARGYGTDDPELERLTNCIP